MHHNWEAKVRRQPVADRMPAVPVIVASQYANARPIVPTAMVLHIQPPRCTWVRRDLVHTLSELGIRIRHESRTHALIRCSERLPTVLAQIMPPGRNPQVHSI